MKLSSIAVSAALAILANAQETTETSSVEHPEFTPFNTGSLESKDFFFEQFDSDDWSKLWKISKAKRDEEFTYNGEWDVEESVIFPGFKNDKGLVLKTPAAHHAISAKLPQPFKNEENDTLVLQYQVKLQNGLNCGGAYIKLLSAEGFPNDSEGSHFNNSSPYEIMFGPDKCGATNKVHFIIRRKNPISHEIEEKHLAVPPLARTVKTSSLYTLIIHPNQDFEIRIGGDVVKAGNLLDEGVLAPPLNPPTEVDDENDTKPEDWDDREFILDPNQTEKPEDWDESAPYLIPDPKSVKPDSWKEDEPEYIDDPEAVKPEDWDDEEDGEWVAPKILNPECENHGCGKWEPELIPNPDYKGKWTQPKIENPNYKGEWAPKKVANPNYFEDKTPSVLNPIGGLGFELWSMDSDILFDNIYLGHSVKDAEKIGNETWSKVFAIEQEEVLALSPKAKDVENPNDKLKKIKDQEESNFIVDQIDNAVAYFKEFRENPLETLSSKPTEAGIYVTSIVVLLSLVLTIFSSVAQAVSSGEPIVQHKEEPKKVEQVQEAEEEVIKEGEGATGASANEEK